MVVIQKRKIGVSRGISLDIKMLKIGIVLSAFPIEHNFAQMST